MRREVTTEKKHRYLWHCCVAVIFVFCFCPFFSNCNVQDKQIYSCSINFIFSQVALFPIVGTIDGNEENDFKRDLQRKRSAFFGKGVFGFYHCKPGIKLKILSFITHFLSDQVNTADMFPTFSFPLRI